VKYLLLGKIGHVCGVQLSSLNASCDLRLGNLQLSDKTWKFKTTVSELCPLSSIPGQNTTFQKLVHLQVASLLFNVAAIAKILQCSWQMNERVWSTAVMMYTGENRVTGRGICYGATWTTANLAWTDLRLNAHFSSKRLKSNSLGHGTASLH